MDFTAATACTIGPEGRGTLIVDPAWGQGRAAFGGVVSGAGLAALQQVVDPVRPPRSVHTQFIGPVEPGEATIETKVLRAGRSLTHARAEIVQKGQIRAQITAAFAEDRPSNITIPAAPAPEVPGPDGLPERPYLEGIMPTFLQGFGMRWARGDQPFTGGQQSIIDGWCAHLTPCGASHTAILGLVDAWPVPVLGMLRWPAPASSVSWTVDFVHVPERVEPNTWWLYRSRVIEGRAGHINTRAELYAPDGRLAAVSEQLVALFDVRKR